MPGRSATDRRQSGLPDCRLHSRAQSDPLFHRFSEPLEPHRFYFFYSPKFLSQFAQAIGFEIEIH